MILVEGRPWMTPGTGPGAGALRADWTRPVSQGPEEARAAVCSGAIHPCLKKYHEHEQ